MTGQTEINIDGRKYQVKYSTCQREIAPRENGQGLWPNAPRYIDDLTVWQKTPKGKAKVTREDRIETIYNQLMEGL
jgi:hypothetical protein